MVGLSRKRVFPKTKGDSITGQDRAQKHCDFRFSQIEKKSKVAVLQLYNSMLYKSSSENNQTYPSHESNKCCLMYMGHFISPLQRLGSTASSRSEFMLHSKCVTYFRQSLYDRNYILKAYLCYFNNLTTKKEDFFSSRFDVFIYDETQGVNHPVYSLLPLFFSFLSTGNRSLLGIAYHRKEYFHGRKGT